MNENWVGVVLAAGKGVRMRSSLPKTLHTVCGRPLVSHVVGSMRAAGIGRTVAVISKNMAAMAEVPAAVGDDTVLAVQAEQLGTADALLSARESVAGASSILVGAGDMALVRPDTIRRMVSAHGETGSAVTVLTANVEKPFGLGRVVRDYAGQPLRVVEEVDADEETRAISEVNTSWYCFDSDWLWDRLAAVAKSPSGEKYLPDLVEAAAVEGGVAAVEAFEAVEAMGANDRVQLAAVEAAMRSRINAGLMKSGVTITDPATTYVDVGVTVRTDTVLLPGTRLTGKTSIGERCEIGPNSTIRDSAVGDDVRITASFVEESTVQSDVTIGPFSHLRPGAVIESGAHIGNYAEIKNSQIGSGTHVGHFSYVGDSSLGNDVNIGAGTVTANFDGETKHSTVIGEGAKIGSGTMIVAPVNIGAKARTGAGSVVTKDVEAGTTVVGVPARPIGKKEKLQAE